MIKISQIPQPNILTINSQTWTADLIAKWLTYYSELNKFNMGQILLEPDKPEAIKSRYAHTEIKEKLAIMFGKKCAYCESNITKVSYRAVEHFRPQSIYPSLAYDWDNLLYCCTVCNSEYKNDQFPLMDGTQSAPNSTNPGKPSKNDSNALIHPVFDEPSDHLIFDYETPLAKNYRGQRTITICGLDRKDLCEERLIKITEIKSVLLIYDKAKSDNNQETMDQCRKIVALRVSKDAEFSAFSTAQVKMSRHRADFSI